MDGITLLQQAHAAGLKVIAEGNQLKIRGPRRAELIAKQLIAHKPVVLDALAKQTAPSVPRDAQGTASPLRQWDAESSALVEFFGTARRQLPMQPFRLTRWRFISDPAKWYAALDQDIAAGPLGVRARMGVLQEDLRLLQALGKEQQQ